LTNPCLLCVVNSYSGFILRGIANLRGNVTIRSRHGSLLSMSHSTTIPVILNAWVTLFGLAALLYSSNTLIALVVWGFKLGPGRHRLASAFSTWTMPRSSGWSWSWSLVCAGKKRHLIPR
jgi:hypothetical protein